MDTMTKERQSPIEAMKLLCRTPPVGEFTDPVTEHLRSMQEKHDAENIASETKQRELTAEHTRLERLAAALDSPLEKAAHMRVDDQMSKLRLQMHSLKTKRSDAEKDLEKEARKDQRYINVVEGLIPRHPVLCVSDVPWMDRRKPRVVPINVAWNAACLSTRGLEFAEFTSITWDNRTLHDLHAPHSELRKRLDEHFRALTQAMVQNVETLFWYEGVIPIETKEAMCKAKGSFTHVLMLADVAQLRTKTVSKPVIGDPLIVGWHDACPDLFWLIASFDMTSIEQLINDQALKGFYERNKD